MIGESKMKKTQLCELLGIEYPVIQAPMNWITWVELAVADVVRDIVQETNQVLAGR
jgi:NAD(P)H-dependent flavin oxidoreductase YrpB (nitropropane dioxygenase family)